MWTSTSMTLVESLILSCMGLLTVLSALAALAVMILLFSKVMENSAKKPAPAVAAAPAAPLPDVSNETAAVVISVVCEEMNAAPEELCFKSIIKL